MTAEEIIDKLQLQPHPEGGFYKETFRSGLSVVDYRLETAIYFLITQDHVSHFHRIRQDELWLHHYGATIDIHVLEDGKHEVTRLGMLSSDAEPYRIVPKNTIFGSSLSENETGFALVSCVVIPGFEFRDFELFTTAELLADFPDCEMIIRKMTRE